MSLLLKVGVIGGLLYLVALLAGFAFGCQAYQRSGGPGCHVFTDSALIKWSVDLSQSTTFMDTSGATSKLVFKMAALRGK
jgi:hypothetical protein